MPKFQKFCFAFKVEIQKTIIIATSWNAKCGGGLTTPFKGFTVLSRQYMQKASGFVYQERLRTFEAENHC